jgi:hypothetical protein
MAKLRLKLSVPIYILIIYIIATLFLLVAFMINYNYTAVRESTTIQSKIDKLQIDNNELKRKYFVEMREDIKKDPSLIKTEPGQMLKWSDVVLEEYR